MHRSIHTYIHANDFIRFDTYTHIHTYYNSIILAHLPSLYTNPLASIAAPSPWLVSLTAFLTVSYSAAHVPSHRFCSLHVTIVGCMASHTCIDGCKARLRMEKYIEIKKIITIQRYSRKHIEDSIAIYR